MRAEDQFHVGIVVDDVDATLAELTARFGYKWSDRIGGPTSVVLPTGPTEVEFSLVYSRTVPRLEIIRSVPGTIWTPVAGSGIHHIGYWCDDVDADARELESSGFTTEAVGTQPDGRANWAYHRGPTGPRIELMSRRLQPLLEHVWGPTDGSDEGAG